MHHKMGYMDDVYFFLFRQPVDFSSLRSVGSSGEMGSTSAVLHRYRYYSRLAPHTDSAFVSTIHKSVTLTVSMFCTQSVGFMLYMPYSSEEWNIFVQLLKWCMLFSLFFTCFTDLEALISCFSLDTVDTCCLLFVANARSCCPPWFLHCGSNNNRGKTEQPDYHVSPRSNQER